MIPIFTTIPPTLSRKDPQGNDIGGEYLSYCIKSWRDNGFNPYSINSKFETLNPLAHTFDVNHLVIDRDASSLYRKPLLYLNDFIEKATAVFNGPIVITNSDITLSISDSDYRKIKNLQPGQCIVKKRVDVDHLGQDSGSIYELGYDFFVYHAQDLLRTPRNAFALGMPWWDHYLPIIQFFKGLTSVPIQNSNCYHLKHSGRWDLDEWVNIGEIFYREVSDNGQGSSMSENHMDYMRQLRAALDDSDARLPEKLKKLIRRFYKGGRRQNTAYMLCRIAIANASWIDHKTSHID